LALINRAWGEIENDLDNNFDAETQVALAWFATYGFDPRPSGDLINVATAKDTTIEALFRSGVFLNLNGKAGLTPREQLPEGWAAEALGDNERAQDWTQLEDQGARHIVPPMRDLFGVVAR